MWCCSNPLDYFLSQRSLTRIRTAQTSCLLPINLLAFSAVICSTPPAGGECCGKTAVLLDA